MPPNSPPPDSPAPADLLTDRERDRLLANLHRTLVWLGVQDPERLEIDPDLLKEEMARDRIAPADLPPEVHPATGTVDLRHLVWRLIHLSELSEKEEMEVRELIRVLKAKEAADEGKLKEARLTREEAHRIYEETAAVIRSLLDLREILAKKEHKTDVRREVIKKKVNDVKRWNAFVDEMEGKR
jgi:vacuolar-type H+-ATPase subunit I/STV1